MNQEDVLKLADAARLSVINDEVYPSQPGYITPELCRFAELVAQHERVACSKLAQDLADMYAKRKYYEFITDAETGLRELEEAILARNKS